MNLSQSTRYALMCRDIAGGLICCTGTTQRMTPSVDTKRRRLSDRSPNKDKVWERQARAIKDTGNFSGDYLEAMRETHDPALHVKTIEDELKSTIGKALGRQGEKILYSTRQMKREYEIYVKEESCLKMKREAADRFNQHRKEALQARWELIVHRQAAGFIVENHNFVVEHYPVADALPTTDDDFDFATGGDSGGGQDSDRKKPSKEKKFADQLDWWQRIGRWK